MLCVRRSADSGFALISVLLALALLTTVGVALNTVGIIELRTSLNHRASTRAVLLADAGATHALALMRGPLSSHSYTELLLGADGISNTEDDGVLAGFGLSDSDVLPDTGVVLGQGRYFATVVNDDGDPSGDPKTDNNFRLRVMCRGETRDGGVADVAIALDALAFPALAVNGDLSLPGNPTLLGPCAGAHANGVLRVNGNPLIDGEVTAVDTVMLSGTISDAGGGVVIPQSRARPIEIPQYDPLDYCGSADYVLRDGWVITVGPQRDSAFAGNQPVMGWRWRDVENTYDLAGNQGQPGIVCAFGNVSISGNPGSEANPLLITILATGSVDVNGNPKIEAAHDDDILIIASGDVNINGNPSGFTRSYTGLIYAGSQCDVNGNPTIQGYMLCGDAPNPPGALELAAANRVNGNPTFTYDCTGGVRRRTRMTSWWETRGQ